MNLKALQNKTILFFGKTRAFEYDEFESQMKFNKINITKEYSDAVALIVEGRMMTPYEQNKSDELYESTRKKDKKIEFITIEALESELSKYINADTLLMSLKLSHDKKRLKGFIKNSTLDDELFFKLIKLFSWNGEDFFENDDNRDITAAIISRFYENIEQNHNVQYATLGLMHLIKQTKNPKLIETIATLEPLVKSFKRDVQDANHAIITSIAKHNSTPQNVLKMLVKKANTYIKIIVAMREDCNALMQNVLYENNEKDITEALSFNSNLDTKLLKKLCKTKKYAKNIAQYINLNDKNFEFFLNDYAKELALNNSLNIKMQEKLISLDDEKIKEKLASNTCIFSDITNKLLKNNIISINQKIFANVSTNKEILEKAFDNTDNHIALSQNISTPKSILDMLGTSKNANVLMNLAINKNTPVAVLYQLQLDRRFERAVKENSAFGAHIKSQNIGWL